MGKLIHLDVGCANAAIIAGNNTFLVDCYDIGRYSQHLPSSKRFRGVFITHPHRDHYDGLRYLKDNGYAIDFLIYSPYERRHGDNSLSIEEWNEFNSLKDHFVAKGTELRAPYKQESWKEAWWKAGDVEFWILGPQKAIATSPTREVHDACLVVYAKMGSRRCLFTGDASDTNLQDVATVKNNCGDILCASHHASINGADLTFIKSADAKYTVISTATGVHDNVPHPTALRRYADNTSEKVYRTDQDGTITFTF